MTLPQRLIIANFTTGLETRKEPFLLNNDAFPTLDNFFLWRDRLRRKPGASQIGRLRRQSAGGSLGNTDGSGDLSVNLIALFSLPAGSTIESGNITITIGTQVFTETLPLDGTLSNGGAGVPPEGEGTIDYVTGAVTINTFPDLAATPATIATFDFFPNLPVMGIESFDREDTDPASPVNDPETVYFNTTKAFEHFSSGFTDISVFRNTGAVISWNGQNFQQFNSWNYQNAMFITNNVPGMHHVPLVTVSIGNPTGFTTTLDELQTGDRVFINEVTETKPTPTSDSFNMREYTVTRTGASTYTVPFDSTGYTLANDGIAQFLTRTPSATADQDGIRWFDGRGISPTFSTGFVNFAPPLDANSTSNTTYLVGARMFISYGARLIAIGTFEGTSANARASSTGEFNYFPNRIRFCQVVGTCFYANAPAGGGTEPQAWDSSVQGFGGFINLDRPDRILTATINQESLILGTEQTQRRVNVTSVETQPYNVQTINPELGSESTHAAIQLDMGTLSNSDYGYVMTTSFNSKRFDEVIPDKIFEISNNAFDNERVTAIRDYRNEIVYFTYSDITSSNVFPDETLVFNYMNNSFAIWTESYTTYGEFREPQSTPWEDIDILWPNFDEPWESGLSSTRFPDVAGGNQQGFVMKKFAGQSNNDPSLQITAFASGNPSSVTSPDHNLQAKQYVGFKNPSDDNVFSIAQVDEILSSSQFEISKDVSGAGTVTPGITELVIVDVPNVFTKQFPAGWEGAKKTRLGTQRYLCDRTAQGEFTVNLLASQSNTPNNDPSFSSIISSNIVRTRADNDLGLTGDQDSQSSLWHRISTNVLGGTVQMQFTMSNVQLQDITLAQSDIVIQAIAIDLYPSGVIA